MTGFLAARRRKRLIAKLNRAWWRNAWLSARQMRHRDPDRWYDVSEDIWAIVKSLEAGEPVDTPFPDLAPSPLDALRAELDRRLAQASETAHKPLR